MSNASRIAHDMQHAKIDVFAPAQAVRQRRMLRRVDDQLGTRIGGRRRIQALIVGGILRDSVAHRALQVAPGEGGDVPGAIYTGAQLADTVPVEALPTVERGRAYPLPKLACP